jgi:putative ATPase
LAKLTDDGIFDILKRALVREVPGLPKSSSNLSSEDQPEPGGEGSASTSYALLTNDNYALVRYLAAFADGDARTGLNLLELALDLCKRPGVTADDIKHSLTQTLVYDRAGDQHYDTISAFHKSVRGSNADAALYYLARMLQSGEDPLFIARRMVVMASEDIGLADNTMLSLATAAYTAAERIGMPECRINLAHCAVALSLAPKSVRAYRGLNAAYAALKEPGIAGLPVPVHLRNAPTKLMKELGYGKEYVSGDRTPHTFFWLLLTIHLIRNTILTMPMGELFRTISQRSSRDALSWDRKTSAIRSILMPRISTTN